MNTKNPGGVYKKLPLRVSSNVDCVAYALQAQHMAGQGSAAPEAGLPGTRTADGGSWAAGSGLVR